MIVFSSVTKQFLPESFALKDVSFDISVGELVLLTGPSGSGKTTIMRLLTKEYSPTSGEILFHNTNLNEIKNSKLHEHRRKIGVVFQDYKLIPELNVWENIALPLSIIGKPESEIEERVTDLLELVSLTERAFHFPKQLSGGEAQRISIARALSTAPSIIFADEPTGNLDKDNSLQIAKLLTKINELGTTILFATHDHDVIDALGKHRHIVLELGTVVSDSGESQPKKSEKKQEKKQEVSEEPEENQKSSEIEETPPKRSFFSSLFGKKKGDKIELSEFGAQEEESIAKSKSENIDTETEEDKPQKEEPKKDTKKKAKKNQEESKKESKSRKKS